MFAIAWWILSACTAPHPDSAPEAIVDVDGDGHSAPLDCDDADPAVSPDAAEVCNAVDDNCDGAVDEGLVYADLDGDGYGDEAATVLTLCVEPGLSDVAGDCDDAEEDVHPGAPEACDGVDLGDGVRSTCWLEDVAEWTFLELDSEHDDGSVVSLDGDVDGDGLADVLVGGGWGGYTWTTYEPEGQVHLFRGANLGFAGPHVLGNADWTLYGAEGSMAAGGHWTHNTGADFLPDLDGDGLSEVLVGGPGQYGGFGTAWLVLGGALQGRSGELALPDIAQQAFVLDAPDDLYLGKSVGLGPDSDGDGFNEIAIGADGQVWLAPISLAENPYDLSTATLIQADCDCSYFGGIVAEPSDFDGDGVDDLLLGDPEYPGGSPYDGRVVMFLGGTVSVGATVLASDADLEVYGPSDVGFGATVGSVGDIDGDGDSDWAVSAGGMLDDSDQSAGLVYLVPGSEVSSAEIEITDISTRQFLGHRGGTLASIDASDFDGDGAVDLALRSANGPGTGRISIVRNVEIPTSGTLDLETAGLSFGPRAEDDGSRPSAISAGGDVNGDGRDDLLIGDRGWDPYASSDSYGQAWLVLGF